MVISVAIKDLVLRLSKWFIASRIPVTEILHICTDLRCSLNRRSTVGFTQSGEMVLKMLAFAFRELGGPPFRAVAGLHILAPSFPSRFDGGRLGVAWRAPQKTSKAGSRSSLFGDLEKWESVLRRNFDCLSCSSVGVWIWSRHARGVMSLRLPSESCSTQVRGQRPFPSGEHLQQLVLYQLCNIPSAGRNAFAAYLEL